MGSALRHYDAENARRSRNYVISGTHDPRKKPTLGPEGTLYILTDTTPTNGGIFQKLDDGKTLNWVKIADRLVQDEMRHDLSVIEKLLDKKANQADTKKEFVQVIKSLEKKIQDQKEEIAKMANLLSQTLVSKEKYKKEMSEMKSSVINLTEKMDRLKDVLDAQFAKMDTDFTAQNAAVTSSQLDVDYKDSADIPNV